MTCILPTKPSNKSPKKTFLKKRTSNCPMGTQISITVIREMQTPMTHLSRVSTVKKLENNKCIKDMQRGGILTHG